MTIDEERELEQELNESRERDKAYEKAVKHLWLWIFGIVAFVIILNILSGGSTTVKTTGGFSLNGETVEEMITDYEVKSGKTLSPWFKNRISEKCAGKERTEQVQIINTIADSAPN
jgi:hypothetical protein